MNPQKAFRLRPLTALIATLAAGSAFAQDATPPAADTQELGAVTVRSRNRIEKLQDVPLSISVIQGEELSRLGATGIEEVTKRAGNVSWNLGNQRTSSLSIRGIGKVGQTEAQDPSVGVIVDGVSYAYNALTSSFDFIDIDTIEVSRGPQGTLLGKNTSVGNIIFNTKKPSFTPTADYGITRNAENQMRTRDKDNYAKYQALGDELKKFDALKPKDPGAISTMVELGPDAPPTKVLFKGIYDRPLQEVQPGLPALLTDNTTLKIEPTATVLRPPHGVGKLAGQPRERPDSARLRQP